MSRIKLTQKARKGLPEKRATGKGLWEEAFFWLALFAGCLFLMALMSSLRSVFGYFLWR